MGGLRSNKPERTSEPKEVTLRTESERGGRERGARSDPPDWPKKVVNIEPVIRPSTPPAVGGDTPAGVAGGEGCINWLYVHLPKLAIQFEQRTKDKAR